MTNQEMFDKAVRGLSKQGWARARRIFSTGHEGCAYEGKDGTRCAWGHVDTTLYDEEGGVRTLRSNGLGLAATLDAHQTTFAADLQDGHDSGYAPDAMHRNFFRLCDRYGLLWPDDVPHPPVL